MAGDVDDKRVSGLKLLGLVVEPVEAVLAGGLLVTIGVGVFLGAEVGDVEAGVGQDACMPSPSVSKSPCLARRSQPLMTMATGAGG
jgi:hypothetical protein